MATFSSAISEQMTLRQFAATYGMPTTAGFLTLKDSNGAPFESNGMNFGSTFVVFSKKIADEHQGQDAFAIAKDILMNAKDYQVIAKPDAHWANGKPIFCLCHTGSKLTEVGDSLQGFCNF